MDINYKDNGMEIVCPNCQSVITVPLDKAYLTSKKDLQFKCDKCGSFNTIFNLSNGRDVIDLEDIA